MNIQHVFFPSVIWNRKHLDLFYDQSVPVTLYEHSVAERGNRHASLAGEKLYQLCVSSAAWE